MQNVNLDSFRLRKNSSNTVGVNGLRASNDDTHGFDATRRTRALARDVDDETDDTETNRRLDADADARVWGEETPVECAR